MKSVVTRHRRRAGLLGQAARPTPARAQRILRHFHHTTEHRFTLVFAPANCIVWAGPVDDRVVGIGVPEPAIPTAEMHRTEAMDDSDLPLLRNPSPYGCLGACALAAVKSLELVGADCWLRASWLMAQAPVVFPGFVGARGLVLGLDECPRKMTRDGQQRPRTAVL